ncbi:hypothetical protein [Nocardiopsis sp. FR26]|uniref:hypothetical protein n=1 Tax=Nocardiopsis sp. FR26 TaxID=2605987 RepID=UPI001359822E|nr:hypothetical protein [Nocardiopsis sp. FR26]
MSWNIHPDPKRAGQVTYRRGGDSEDQTAPSSLVDLLRELETLEEQAEGWYVGFRHPSPAWPDRVDELWAQYPGETVVHAATVAELRTKMAEARKTLNL